MSTVTTLFNPPFLKSDIELSKAPRPLVEGGGVLFAGAWAAAGGGGALGGWGGGGAAGADMIMERIKESFSISLFYRLALLPISSSPLSQYIIIIIIMINITLNIKKSF